MLLLVRLRHPGPAPRVWRHPGSAPRVWRHTGSAPRVWRHPVRSFAIVCATVEVCAKHINIVCTKYPATLFNDRYRVRCLGKSMRCDRWRVQRKPYSNYVDIHVRFVLFAVVEINAPPQLCVTQWQANVGVWHCATLSRFVQVDDRNRLNIKSLSIAKNTGNALHCITSFTCFWKKYPMKYSMHLIVKMSR